MTTPATELTEAKLQLDAALQAERNAFDTLVELAENEGDAAKIDSATTSLEQANDAVTALQRRITELEAALK